MKLYEGTDAFERSGFPKGRSFRILDCSEGPWTVYESFWVVPEGPAIIPESLDKPKGRRLSKDLNVFEDP